MKYGSLWAAIVAGSLGVYWVCAALAQDRPGGKGGPLSFESVSLPNTEAEKKILDVLGGLQRNQSRGMMNVPARDGRLLRLLTEAVGAGTSWRSARRTDTRASGSAWRCGRRAGS